MDSITKTQTTSVQQHENLWTCFRSHLMNYVNYINLFAKKEVLTVWILMCVLVILYQIYENFILAIDASISWPLVWRILNIIWGVLDALIFFTTAFIIITPIFALVLAVLFYPLYIIEAASACLFKLIIQSIGLLSKTKSCTSQNEVLKESAMRKKQGKIALNTLLLLTVICIVGGLIMQTLNHWQENQKLGAEKTSHQLLHDFPRGHQTEGICPSASFEPPENILNTSSLDYSETKIFLGLIDAAIKKHRLPNGRLERYAIGGSAVGIDDDRHIFTIAGSRAGKGRAVLIPNHLSYPGSILSIDPKGELASITARYRAEVLKQKVYILDPFGTTSEHVSSYQASYNPLTILDPDDPSIIENAGLIADALVVPSGSDQHWDECARNFIEGCILHVATHQHYQEERTLITVRNLIMGQNASLAEEMLFNTAASGAVVDSAKDFFEKQDRERDSVLSTARRHIRFLTYLPMQNVLSGDSINLNKLKTENTTIYLCLPAMRMSTCSRWFRLFVNLALAMMEQEKYRPSLPVLFSLDEFAVLGHMKSIEDAAGQLAGFGCKLWPVLQDLGQLKALYKERWETFVGNAGVLQFFGNNDLTTLDWISKRLGQTTIRTQSESDITLEARSNRGETGQSWSHHVHDLMTAEEVSRFFGRDDHLLRQLIIRPGFNPMILQRAYYDKHELFEGRFDDV